MIPESLDSGSSIARSRRSNITGWPPWGGLNGRADFRITLTLPSPVRGEGACAEDSI